MTAKLSLMGTRVPPIYHHCAGPGQNRSTSRRFKRSCLGFVFVVFVLFANAHLAQAQWTPTGNDISNTNSGNVGVGTASPQSLLHVYGSSGTVNVLIGNGINSESRLRLSYDFTADKSVINSYRGASGYKAFEIDGSSLALNANSGGNVGIGTASPDTSLNVKAAHNTWRIGDVYSASNQYAGLSDAAPDATSYFLLSRVGVSGGDRYVNAPTGGSLDLQIGGSSAVTIVSGRNVGIGTTSVTAGYKLDVSGDLKVSGSGNINANGTIEAGNIKAKYQDVAEWVPSSEQLSAGTVVVLDPTKSNQVTLSSLSYDTRVAGVVSAQPGIALGEKTDNKVLVATTGRVKVKVDASKGAIHIGDLLVTSDIPGVAMKSQPVNLGGVQIHRPGTLIGKALEPMEKGSGEILVLLSLQ